MATLASKAAWAAGTHRVMSTTQTQWVRNLLTMPFIYSLTIPLVLLDVWVSLYQTLCFPLFGIPRVSRQAYVVIDRHRLPYLNALEKAHCAYCGYATGVLSYAREIAAQTEQYWCPIKHTRPVPDPHRHYQLFLDYGDGSDYYRRLDRLRHRLRPARSST